MAVPTISSTRNPRVREALELRERRARDRTGLTLVDGRRELARALDAGVRIVDLFLTPAAGDRARDLVEQAGAAGAAVTLVDERVIGRLAYGDRTEGLVAVVGIPDTSLSPGPTGADPLLVVLEGVEKPGNLGAVVRTADATGARPVVLADARTDPFNPNAIRASLGTMFSVPIAAATSAEIVGWLRAKRIPIVALRVDGDIDYADADLRGPLAITLGSEAGGLTDAWRGDDVISVRVPMLGAADSLNVSITAAVVLFEARRQRRVASDTRMPPAGVTARPLTGHRR